ncbi:MAG: hypothetical protein AAFY26_02055 [Cyanobacteria bacterium J06638_22]
MEEAIAIPFDIPPADNFVTVGNEQAGTIKIPKYGSVTCREQLLALPILKQMEGFSEGDDLRVMFECHKGLATLAMQRICSGWLDSDTERLAQPLVEELSAFLLREHDRWAEHPDGEGEESGKKSTGRATKNPSSTTSQAPSTSSTADSPKGFAPTTSKTSHSTKSSKA